MNCLFGATNAIDHARECDPMRRQNCIPIHAHGLGQEDPGVECQPASRIQYRPVFGKFRYMNANGLKRKFDIEGYVDRVRRLSQASEA